MAGIPHSGEDPNRIHKAMKWAVDIPNFNSEEWDEVDRPTIERVEDHLSGGRAVIATILGVVIFGALGYACMKIAHWLG